MRIGRVASAKQVEALRLREQEGLAYQQIADALGYSSRQGAYQAVEFALEAHGREKPDLSAYEDALLASLIPRLDSGDLRAVADFFRLQARKAKRLQLDILVYKKLRRAYYTALRRVYSARQAKEAHQEARTLRLTQRSAYVARYLEHHEAPLTTGRSRASETDRRHVNRGGALVGRFNLLIEQER